MKGKFEYTAGAVAEGMCGGSRVSPPRPSAGQRPLPYTLKEIAELLASIPEKADKSELHELGKFSDVNYVGHVAEASALPEVDGQPAWALVGSVKAAAPYFYYVAPYVAKGYKEGWNDMSGVLGTYDLTVDKVSIFDYTLLTEYNVSNNHVHESMVYSLDWRRIPYSEVYPLYEEERQYAQYERVRMASDEEHSYECVKRTKEAPYTIETTTLFTLTEAIDSTPEEYRVAGMKLTFSSSESHEAETWVFLGVDKADWTDESKWQKVDYTAERNDLKVKEVFKEAFDLPSLTAARAIADEFGRRFTDEYLRREEVLEYITDVFNKLFTENPPTILNGYITPEMLSEETKEMVSSPAIAKGYITPEMLSEAVKELIGSDSVTNLPDEEDLTTVDGLLKLKDRPYAPGKASGKGYKLLRYNMVNGVNLLKQGVMNEPNTVYEARYDFDLGGETVTLPEGSVLMVKGGSFKNGVLDLNGCLAHIPGQFWEECFKATVEVKGVAPGQMVVHSDSLQFMRKDGLQTIV
jgi:hypothetical protein